MKTKIATTFGLALMLGLGLFATMLALGTFNDVTPVHAAQTSAAVITVEPDKARDTAQYTIAVSSTTAIAVGQRIFVTFPSGTGMPSSIATANVKIKAALVSDPTGGTNYGTGNQTQDAAAITISTRTVAITVPDMNTGTNTGSAPENAGDNGIRASSLITVTFLQAAAIQNPNTARAVGATSDYNINVRTDTDTTDMESAAYGITSSITLSSSSKPRGDVITVSGVGLNANCAVCNIRFANDAGATIHGNGTIDALGVFSGTFNVDAGTAVDDANPITVTDATGVVYTSAASFTNKAGAIPQVTSAIPGAKVKVDLFDFTASASATITTGTLIGIIPVTNSNIITTGSQNTVAAAAYIIDSGASGNSPTLFPYRFTLPATADIPLGTYIVTVTDSSAKKATFTLEVTSGVKTLTVTPNPASIGQTITVEGTGFTKTTGRIQVGGLTAAGASINPSDVITVDSVGNWSFVTRLATDGSAATRPAVKTTDLISIVATEFNADTGGTATGVVGKSSGFNRIARAMTADPTTAAPGAAVALSGSGMTVDTNLNLTNKLVATTASVTVTLSTGTLTSNVFPIASDGTWFGNITLPIDASAGTLTLTATDNAFDLNDDSGLTSGGRTATAKVTVPAGTVTVDPVAASTGESVTVSGTNFPPNRSATALSIGGASAIPAGGVQTGSNGTFSVLIEVPAATTGGSLPPGVKLVVVQIGQITGSTTGFAIPNPSIVLTPTEAEVGATIEITGSGFNALSNVDVLTIGIANVNPSPAPRASRTGEITASIVIPALNPGTYTVVMNTGTGFAATATFGALAAPAATATPVVSTETVTEGTPTEVFSAAVESVPGLQVWSFDGETQTWAFFDAGLDAEHPANSLAQVESGDGVWMFNDTDSNQSVDILGRSATLYPGWNLVGL